MNYTEQELAEKMKQRLAGERDRQRRWRLRQREKGLKPVAGMISQEAQAVLNAAKKETGETTSAILEKAILNLPGAIPPDTTERSPQPSSVADPCPQKKNDSDDKEDIINRIQTMRQVENLPFNEIAKIFNAEQLKTPAGEEEWDGKIIYTIFKNIKDQ